MTKTSWLRKALSWKGRASHRANRSSRSSPVKAARLSVESLESRTLLSGNPMMAEEFDDHGLTEHSHQVMI